MAVGMSGVPLGPGVWAGMLSLWSTLGPFWAPSTAMSQGLLPSPASLSRMRWQPLPVGEALATRLASLGSSTYRNLARGLQEMSLEWWLLLLTEPAVSVSIPLFY